MKKDFHRWNRNKIWIDRNKKRPFFKEREVWWITLGENIGSEENGKGTDFRRPVLVFKKFNTDLFWGIPLSTKIKRNNPFYQPIILEGQPEQSLIISQIRMLDAKRLLKRIDTISEGAFVEIRKAVIDLC